MITIQELYTGLSTKESDKAQFLLATISPLKILPFTFDVAQLAGEISRDLPRPISLADAAIAATTIINKGQLITLNNNDFQDIPELLLSA